MMIATPKDAGVLFVFKAYLKSDHVTEATGKTINITISKAAGAFVNPSGGATSATAISAGWYYVQLTATDCNTLGPLAIRGVGSLADIDEIGFVYRVVNANNYGMLALPDAAAQASGGLYTRGTGVGQIIQSVNGTIDVNTILANGVALDDTATVAAAVRAEMDANSTKLVSILDDTDDIGVAGAGLTAINLPDQVMNITGNITGNVSGSVGSVTGGGTLANQTTILANIAALPTAAVNATALADLANGVETGVTPRQAWRYAAAAAVGKISGAGSSAISIFAVGNPGTLRILTTGSDADGNRPTVTLS